MHGVIYYRTDIFAMTHKHIVAKISVYASRIYTSENQCVVSYTVPY